MTSRAIFCLVLPEISSKDGVVVVTGGHTAISPDAALRREPANGRVKSPAIAPDFPPIWNKIPIWLDQRGNYRVDY